MTSPTNKMKAALGFVLATQRKSCHNCYHVASVGTVKEPRLQCKKGGFLVTSMATCDQHQPWQPPAKAQA